MREKQKKTSKYSGRYRKYSPDKLLKAYEEVKLKKLSIRKIALQYGIPYQTLRDRVSGRIDSENIGKETIFSKEEELVLVEEAKNSAKLGYGLSNKGIQKTAGEIAYKLGRRPKDKPLSNCWLYGFLKRWNTRISSVKPSALETNRARHTTPEKVSTYFGNLEQTILDHGLQDKPHLIYNLDETGISPEHRPPNVIAPIQDKAQAVTSPRTASTTLIGCANAAGNHLPPFFVFKGKKMNDALMNGTTPGSRAVMSDSGWSTSAVFQDYLEHHFLPNVQRGPNDNQPVLLILDGHSTHTSRQMIQWALSKNIVLFVLPAHSSHILQPLDVAVFGPFKRYYYSECSVYMKENMGKVVTRYEMGAIACKAYLKAMSPWNIVTAFRKTGIYPLNKEAVPAEKLLPCEAFRDDTPIEKLKAIKAGKEAIAEYFRQKQVAPSPCICHIKPKCLSMKPNPGGKEITSKIFVDELDNFEHDKENAKPRSVSCSKAKPKRSNKVIPLSPQPTTSGLNILVSSESEDESEPDEKDLCCVCKRLSPPNLNDRPHLKIVTWAECDKCGHWVHLSFCHKKHVIRRGDEFLCHHCC